jgi:hypothetical protein
LKQHGTSVMALAITALFGTPLAAQQSAATASDVYHVHFTKSAPGQGTALGEVLKKPDPDSPMPDHFIVLRHQQGDDWDYCVVQHIGPKATVDPAPSANPGRDLRSWHTDTFVSGPSWPEFAKALGIDDSAKSTAGSVYVVAVWRPVPGHRDQLGKTLREPEPSKVPVSRVVLEHLEGGAWQFLAIDRYNSWQDFATDQAASTPSTESGKDPWSQIREHGSYHHDTLADRVSLK